MRFLSKTLGMMTLAAVAVGCGGRETAPTSPDCTGACGGEASDAGTRDAGTPPTGGTPSDGGTSSPADGGVQTAPREVTVSEARAQDYGAWVKMKGVVIQRVEYTKKGTSGTEWSGRYWVVDPANPKQGLWVYKFYTDTPADHEPKAGDVFDIEGYLHYKGKFEQQSAYRPQLASRYYVDGTQQPLRLTNLSTATPPADNEVSVAGGFGDAKGGTNRPSPEYAGSRVHIAGPLTIKNLKPTAMHRVSSDAADTKYYGFEVEGGILVYNDPQYLNCGWRAKAEAGETVTFPNGLRGTWETYSFAACTDGSTSTNCSKNPAEVPGTRQPGADIGNKFTYVLYPENCDKDLAGQ